MTVEVSKNDAPTFLWMHEVERQISVRWVVYIEDLILFFIYYDADSVNLCLVVCADSKLMCWDCVFHKDGNSSLCSAFSVMPEHLIASHGEALVLF